MLAGLDNPVQAARSLIHDERLVIARLGPDGAIACSANGEVVVPGFVVEVVDTVGAGDAFNAGFIAARLAASVSPRRSGGGMQSPPSQSPDRGRVQRRRSTSWKRSCSEHRTDATPTGDAIVGRRASDRHLAVTNG